VGGEATEKRRRIKKNKRFQDFRNDSVVLLVTYTRKSKTCGSKIKELGVTQEE